MMIYLWFVLAGAFAGTCAGLFGIGGGMIIVPALIWIFSAYGYSSDIVSHLAIGTSLATIIITSISSLSAHHKCGNVRWDIWKNMALGLIIGSLLGASVAKKIDGHILQAMIGMTTLLVAFKMFFLPNKEHLGKPLPSSKIQFMAGSGIGAASAIFGIGGGSLTVPFLNYAGLSMKQSVGTSASCGLPIAIAGALGFAWFGKDVENLPFGTIGFVNVQAFICISIVSFIMAKVGARLAHQLPAMALKKAFGILLVFVGCDLLLSSIKLL